MFLILSLLRRFLVRSVFLLSFRKLTCVQSAEETTEDMQHCCDVIAVTRFVINDHIIALAVLDVNSQLIDSTTSRRWRFFSSAFCCH